MLTVNWVLFCVALYATIQGTELVHSADVLKIKSYGSQILNKINMPSVAFSTNIMIARQPFAVGFDTTFNDYFVPAKGQGMSPVHFDRGYDRSRKPNYGPTSAQYIGVQLNGTRYLDEISLADGKYFNFTFMAAETSSVDLSQMPWDGIIGLGPLGLNAAGQRWPNLVMNLKQQNVIQLPLMGFYFNPSYNRDRVFELTLGGLNRDWAKNMDYVECHNNTDTWSVSLTSVAIGQQEIGCNGRDSCQAIIFTGMSDIYGPADQVAAIYRAIGLQPQGLMTRARCETLNFNVDIAFKFWTSGSNVWRQLPSRYFIKKMRMSEGDLCYVSIYPSSLSNVWLLGTDFLSAHYTAIDVQRNVLLMSRDLNM